MTENTHSAWQDFINTVGDTRLRLLDVRLEEGLVRGIAEPSLREAIAEFATCHSLSQRVSYPLGENAQVMPSRVFLRSAARVDAEVVSEAIHGEAVLTYDRQGEFVRVATLRDGYLGWVRQADIRYEAPKLHLTHQVSVPRAHLYAKAAVSASSVLELSMAVRLSPIKEESEWIHVATAVGVTGFVRRSVITQAKPLSLTPDAVIRLARRFLESPYVWGGVSAWGLDCSGLVQTVFSTFGFAVPRDADQQEQWSALTQVSTAQAADLLFFPGHVAIATGPSSMIHANASNMRVTEDSFKHIDDVKPSSIQRLRQ